MAETRMDPIPLTHLSRKQRRVLGTLLEKGFTTPDQYPLTLKATVSGCNQKSNREPTTNYDEDAVQQTLEELREIGFVAALHTEGGRTERYRHYLRHRTTLTERQLAIMTELMLRGRQQLGELRTRASRMVDIPTQEELRTELQALLEAGLVRSNGALERRGVEVDHNLYNPGENHEALSAFVEDSVPAPRAASSTPTANTLSPSHSSHQNSGGSSSGSSTNAVVQQLETRVAELAAELSELRSQVSELKDTLTTLRQQLGA